MIFFVQTTSEGTVEQYLLDRTAPKNNKQVGRHDVSDRGVARSQNITGLNHVPKGDLMFEQQANLLFP